MSSSSDAGGEWGRLVELIEKAKFAMMATVTTSDGTIRSRPMATQHIAHHEKGTLWFFTGHHSGKVDELHSNPQVNLGYIGDGQSLFISVSGKGELNVDKAKMKELWNPTLKAWFPQGLDDPEIALIKVTVTQAEYWNNNSPKVVQVSRSSQHRATEGEAITQCAAFRALH
jgi:general stress protein 26